jgi:hypothetical protein
VYNELERIWNVVVTNSFEVLVQHLPGSEARDLKRKTSANGMTHELGPPECVEGGHHNNVSSFLIQTIYSISLADKMKSCFMWSSFPLSCHCNKEHGHIVHLSPFNGMSQLNKPSLRICLLAVLHWPQCAYWNIFSNI